MKAMSVTTVTIHNNTYHNSHSAQQFDGIDLALKDKDRPSFQCRL